MLTLSSTTINSSIKSKPSKVSLTLKQATSEVLSCPKITLVIASVICLGIVHTFSTPKTSHSYRKLDTTNVTTTVTSGKKSVTLNDQTSPKDLKAFSDGTLSLSDTQGTAKREIKDIELVNTKNGTTLDHLEYGKETSYRDYFGFHYDKESKNVLRVVFKTDELNKRFGD